MPVLQTRDDYAEAINLMAMASAKIVAIRDSLPPGAPRNLLTDANQNYLGVTIEVLRCVRSMTRPE